MATLLQRASISFLCAAFTQCGGGLRWRFFVIVSTDLTSRQHAQVEYRRGRFVLVDNSANGTVVVMDEGGTSGLRRDHIVLRGSGTICLGADPERNPDGVLRYRCE